MRLKLGRQITKGRRQRASQLTCFHSWSRPMTTSSWTASISSVSSGMSLYRYMNSLITWLITRTILILSPKGREWTIHPFAFAMKGVMKKGLELATVHPLPWREDAAAAVEGQTTSRRQAYIVSLYGRAPAWRGRRRLWGSLYVVTLGIQRAGPPSIGRAMSASRRETQVQSSKEMGNTA